MLFLYYKNRKEIFKERERESERERERERARKRKRESEREKIEEENLVYPKLLHKRRTRNYYQVYYHTKVNNL